MSRLRYLLPFALALFTASVFGQTITSSIIGTVVDPAGAVVASAEITLTNQGTNAVNRAATDSTGLFRMTNLFSGTYTIEVGATGFKSLRVTNVELGASETRDLGRLQMSIGNVTESVSVTGEVAAVQTATSDRTAVIDSSQLNVDAVKGRDVMSYMKLLPGVIDTSTGRDAAGGTPLGGLTFSGNTGIVGFSVDGATDIDTGCSSCFTHFEPNIDSIGEVRVLMSNVAAEYGRNSGATVSVTTKSGTKDFHGSGWWTHRHEDLNANQFFNNQTGLQIPRYRYNIAGWSLGGPVFIPKVFNKSKQRLFFFASQEYTNQLVNASNQYRTTPTAIERMGDFSQSVDAGGKLIIINDPQTGAPFPGNKIPQTRINGWGQAMLNFFPLPNAVFAPGTAQFLQDNFQAAASGTHPRRNDIIRIDAVATSKLNGFFRYGHDYDFSDALYQSIQFNTAVQGHPNPGTGYVGTVNYTFSPTLINQATYNYSYNFFSYYEEVPAQVARELANGTQGSPQAGLPLPSLFPLHPLGPGPGGDLLEGPAKCSNGYCDYLPGFSFGGTPPNAVSFAESNVDYINTNQIRQFSDSLTKIWGNHSFKTGIYIERNRKLQPGGPSYTGSYSFSPDTSNPGNTGNGFANALLGNYTTYTENSGHFVYDVYYWNTEFYLQDDWRIGKRLTLNYGVRFYHVSPQIDKLKEFSYLDTSKYQLSKAPRIYTPMCRNGAATCSGANRVGVDASTGAQVPSAEIGLFVPGTGDPANGMVVDGVNSPFDTYTNAYLLPAYRVGFALDVFGDGKTALRGGWGMFYDRLDGNQVYNMSGQPPVGYQPTAYYGNISNLATAGGLLSPVNISQWNGDTPVPQNRTASLGLQRNIGWGTVLDVAYQGTYGLNRPFRVNLNPVPLGANFDPRFADTTQAITNPQQPPHLPSALERVKYPGFGDINQEQFGGKSRYDGLQLSIRHRLQNGFTFGASYTWSHSFAILSFDPLVANNYQRNWGPQGSDRRHVAAINYSYDLPRPGHALHMKPLGVVTDGWTLSGIATFSTGAPFTPVVNTTSTVDFTGSPNEGVRIDVAGDPFANIPKGGVGLPHGQLWFNPAAFTQPKIGTIGNAGVNIMYGPGFANWDMNLTRSARLWNEHTNLQFRLEAFNVFNHTQFTGVNATYRFDANGVNTNSNIGALTGERGPRIMALELRLRF